MHTYTPLPSPFLHFSHPSHQLLRFHHRAHNESRRCRVANLQFRQFKCLDCMSVSPPVPIPSLLRGMCIQVCNNKRTLWLLTCALNPTPNSRQTFNMASLFLIILLRSSTTAGVGTSQSLQPTYCESRDSREGRG
jgi:hypothetical protein